MKNLGILNAKIFKSSFNRPNLYYEVRAKTKNIDHDIIRFVKQNISKSELFIVYQENVLRSLLKYYK